MLLRSCCGAGCAGSVADVCGALSSRGCGAEVDSSSDSLLVLDWSARFCLSNANGFPLGREGGVMRKSGFGDGESEMTGLLGGLPWADGIFSRTDSTAGALCCVGACFGWILLEQVGMLRAWSLRGGALS